MAVRTTDAAVGGIIEVDTTITVTPFIEAASAMVDQHCSATAYTTTQLELIERYLSAHFYTLRDPRATQEQAKGVGQSFQSAVGLGMDTSHYGQMAKRLDYEGGLAALDMQSKKGSPRTIGLTYVGVAASEDLT